MSAHDTVEMVVVGAEELPMSIPASSATKIVLSTTMLELPFSSAVTDTLIYNRLSYGIF